MAFTEPIRLDDVVIIEGEWGRIEDIRLTYVVLRVWDDRRLVVPVSYFLAKPFQPCTPEPSDLLGTVFSQVDPRAAIARTRTKVEESSAPTPRLDKRVTSLDHLDNLTDPVALRVRMRPHTTVIAT